MKIVNLKLFLHKILVKSTISAYQFYQILRFASMMLISILLVKSGFSKVETSGFELFVFIANIVSFFWIMGISNSVLSYYDKQDHTGKKHFFVNVFYLLQSAGFITAILVYFTAAFSMAEENTILNSNNNLLILSAYIFFYAPTLLIELYYILKENQRKLKNYGMIIFGLQFVLIVLSILFFDNINMVFKAMLLWIFIRWLWTVILIFREGYNFMPGQLKSFLFFTLPIIIHILLSNGMDYIDGILVNRFFPDGEFAIYRYGARQFPLFIIMISALRSVAIPMAVKNIDSAQKEIKAHTSKLMNIFFPVAIILMLSSRYIYVVVFSEEYSYSSVLFNIYLLILSSMIILPEVFLYAKQRYKILMYVSGFELLFNIFLSLVLMDKYGMAGIAFATFVSFLLSKVFLIYYTKAKININLNTYLDIKRYILFTALLYVSFVISLWLS